MRLLVGVQANVTLLTFVNILPGVCGGLGKVAGLGCAGLGWTGGHWTGALGAGLGWTGIGGGVGIGNGIG
jgi:hypothetical protein